MYTVASAGMGRCKKSFEASKLVSSKNAAGSLIKADSKRLAAWMEVADPMELPVGPRLVDVFGLRPGFFGSGAGTSPRFIARLS